MTDSISKLYAEIGFKVNTEGLDQAKKLLSSFAEQLSQINNLIQKQASLYGVFVKERARQETEKEKQATEQRKAETQRIKQSIQETSHKQQLEKLAFKEEMQEKRFKQKEQEHLWKVEEAGLRKHNDITLKSVKRNIVNIGKAIASGAKTVAGLTRGLYSNMIAPSLDRSIATRDFMLYSGTPLDRIQAIQERLVNVGSKMTQEEMMGELSTALDNITKIGFGRGTTSGFKLSGLQAITYRRDISKLLDAISNATIDIDNQKLVELLNEVGLNGQSWLPYFRAQQRESQGMPRLNMAEQKSLEEARISINQLVYSFQKISEIFSARLTPAIQKASDLLRATFIQTLENLDKNGFAKQIDEIAKELSDFIKSLSPKGIADGIKMFFEAIKDFARIVNWLAEKLGLAEKKEKKEESYSSEKDNTVKFLGIPLWVKKPKENGSIPTEKLSSVDMTKNWYQPSKPTAVNIYNNQTVTTNVETSSDDVGNVVRDSVKEGVNQGGKEQFLFARDTWVYAGTGEG